MVGPSYLKTLLPLQAFSFKSPSSTLSSMKIKTLIHTLICAQFCRLIRAFSKAKSIVIQIYKENRPIQYFISNSKTTKKNYKHKKLFFGSFRLHYNWCSSHVTPVPAPVLEGCTAAHLYYDSTWNSVISTEQCDQDTVESELSGYLQWLEEKKVNGNSTTETDINEIDKQCDQDTVESELSGYLQWLEEKKVNGNSTTETDINEIDKLAEMFIANSHEKFRLEKQESYRRFQEMMARSM